MRIIALLIFTGFYYCLPAQVSLYKEKILFEYKSVSLTAQNLKQIRTVWERLPLDAAVELLLVSDKEIRKLSPGAVVTLTKSRAESVKLFLTTQKLVNLYDIELNLRSFIEDEAIHGTDASFKRIVRDPYKIYSVVLSKEVPICYNYTNAERRALNSKAPAVFHMNSSQDTMIKGPHGVIVLIPANSFLLPGEKRSAEVCIKLWEFLSIEDMLEAGLSTMSSGRLLETGGMIYITAECEGTCLRLLRSSKIIVKFPVGEKVDGMRLFKGIPHAEIIDWKKTGSKDKDTLTPPEGTGERDSGMVNYYVLESAGLGWINCDKFSDVTEKTNVSFSYTGNFNCSAGLIFTGINSIMPGDYATYKNKVTFSGVPTGMEAVVLIFAVSTDKKKIYYAAKKVVLGNALTEELKLTETTVADFKQMLKTIRY